MKGLSALAKFLGVYDDFIRMVRSYGLKWGGRSSDDLIIDRLNKVLDPDEIFNWIIQAKENRSELPDFLDLMAITGLRLVEAVSSYNLTIDLWNKESLGEYFNEGTETLEHFHFKELFIRRSKSVHQLCSGELGFHDPGER